LKSAFTTSKVVLTVYRNGHLVMLWKLSKDVCNNSSRWKIKRLPWRAQKMIQILLGMTACQNLAQIHK